MGKHKQIAMEAIMERMLDDTKVVKIGDESWPYLINNDGTLWARPFTLVKPFIDSRLGCLMHTLRRGDVEKTISLKLLMAHVFIKNENGYNDARLKSGDPGVAANYRIDNIEWYQNETANNDAAVKASNNAQNDLGVIVWCRTRQGYTSKRIADELGISTDYVKELLGVYDPLMVSKFQFKNNPKTTRMNKFDAIRPFIIYLVNSGVGLKDVRRQVRLLVPEADEQQVYTTVRVTRRNYDAVLPQYRCS